MATTLSRVNFISAVKFSSDWISVRTKRTAATSTVLTMRTTMAHLLDSSISVVAAQTCVIQVIMKITWRLLSDLYLMFYAFMSSEI